MVSSACLPSEVIRTLLLSLFLAACFWCAQVQASPALLDEIDSTEVDPSVWRNTFVTILVVSSLAILGPAVLPCLDRSWTAPLLEFFIALGAGVLLGDAFLHLIPSALGVHTHDDDDHDHDHDHNMTTTPSTQVLDEVDHLAFLWVSLTVVLVIYFMFLIEKNVLEYFGLGHFSSGHTHSHSHSHSLDGQIPREPPAAILGHHADAGESAGLLSGNRRASIMSTNGAFGSDPHTGEEPRYSSVALPTSGEVQPTISKSVGWFIFFGDFVHNFVDGVVIGASFAVSFDAGISTSLAVILHEIPHEIADFAILISAGFTKKAAVMMCFADQVTAFLGGYVGVMLGHDSATVSYVTAATAGIFIYLALVDLFPLIGFFPGKDTLGKVALRNVAVLAGIAAMVAISLVEELPHT